MLIYDMNIIVQAKSAFVIGIVKCTGCDHPMQFED